MRESLAYADAHPDEARRVIGTYTKITPEVIAQVTLPKWPPEVNRASVQTLADLGLIGKAGATIQLTKKSNAHVQELAFFHLAQKSTQKQKPGRHGR